MAKRKLPSKAAQKRGGKTAARRNKRDSKGRFKKTR